MTTWQCFRFYFRWYRGMGFFYALRSALREAFRPIPF